MGNPKGCSVEKSSQPSASAFQQPKGNIFAKSFLIHSWPLRLSRGKGDLCALLFSQKTSPPYTSHPAKNNVNQGLLFSLQPKKSLFLTTLALMFIWWLFEHLYFSFTCAALMAGRQCVCLDWCTASLLQVKLLGTAWRTAMLHLGESELESKMCWVH